MDFSHSLGQSVIFPENIEEHQVKSPDPETATFYYVDKCYNTFSCFWLQILDMIGVSKPSF